MVMTATPVRIEQYEYKRRGLRQPRICPYSFCSPQPLRRCVGDECEGWEDGGYGVTGHCGLIRRSGD